MTFQRDEILRCCLNEILQTWCHCAPAKTPSNTCMIDIRVEEYFHCIGYRCDSWWLEVQGRRWVPGGVAAAVVHQGCPVPIGDLDIVVLTLGMIFDIKVGELQPQYLPGLHL